MMYLATVQDPVLATSVAAVMDPNVAANGSDPTPQIVPTRTKRKKHHQASDDAVSRQMLHDSALEDRAQKIKGHQEIAMNYLELSPSTLVERRKSTWLNWQQSC